jgi:histidyl-tRNA synthetase
VIDDFLTGEAADFFARVTDGLDAAGVAWERAPRLVRGLDYYRHTAFEFVTDRLGAQGTVLAGGRYDGLIETLGGPHTPAVGWAAGIERLAMMIEHPGVEPILAAVIPLGEAAEATAINVLADLRRRNFSADMSFRGNMKKRMQRANAANARFAVIIGEDEIARQEASVKELATGEQTNVAFSALGSYFLDKMFPPEFRAAGLSFVGNVKPE